MGKKREMDSNRPQAITWRAQRVSRGRHRQLSGRTLVSKGINGETGKSQLVSGKVLDVWQKKRGSGSLPQQKKVNR